MTQPNPILASNLPGVAVGDWSNPAPQPTSRTLGPVVDVGAPSGDSTGAADGAAITAAIGALNSSYGGKGVLQLRAGQYFDNAQRDLHGATSVILRGVGGMSGGATPATRVNYTGVASSYLNLQGSIGACVEDVMLFASNAGFTGKVIDLSNFSALGHVERCYVGALDTTASVLIYLDNAEDGQILGGNLVGGLYGIQGIAAAGHLASQFLVLPDRIGGQGAAGACIAGIGQGWLVHSTFERQNGQRAIAAGPSPAQGGAILGSWFGDGTGANPVIELYANGMDVRGNYVGGTATSTGMKFMGASDGVSIVANRLDTHSLGIDKNGQTVTNPQIGPNSYTNVTTHHNFTANGTPYVEA